MHETRTITCLSTYPRPNAPSLPGPATALYELILIKFVHHIRYSILGKFPKFQVPSSNHLGDVYENMWGEGNKTSQVSAEI